MLAERQLCSSLHMSCGVGQFFDDLVVMLKCCLFSFCIFGSVVVHYKSIICFFLILFYGDVYFTKKCA